MLKYEHPLILNSPNPISILSVKHGVTEISLSDGRILRLTIHVQGIKPDLAKVDVSYAVISELVVQPEMPIMDMHEVMQ